MFLLYQTKRAWSARSKVRAAAQDGIEVNFVKAEQSVFRWGGDDEALIRSYGHRVLPLAAGHWVHTDNPDGLLDLLLPSFGGAGGGSGAH